MLQKSFIAHEQEEDGPNKTSRPEQEEDLSLKLSQILRGVPRKRLLIKQIVGGSTLNFCMSEIETLFQVLQIQKL